MSAYLICQMKKALSFLEKIDYKGGRKEKKMSGQELFKKLSERGCSFLGTRYPFIGGAMASISTHQLVSSMANAGIFGFLAAGFLNPEGLRAEIRKTKEQTDKPFGVNLIVLHPELEGLMDVCIEEKISHVILASGVPSPEMIFKLKKGNIKVLSFAPALAIAKRLVKSGIDALVIEGNESGGHIGPVSSLVLMQEILPYIKEVPVFMAGGIGSGMVIAMSLLLGAAGCQMGTVFVGSTESPVHENFKKAIYRASSRHAVQTTQISPVFPVIPVRSLENKAHEKFSFHQKQVIEQYEKGELSLEEARIQIEQFWAGSLGKAVREGDVENGSVMAGQIVGLVKKEETIEQTVERLVDETKNSLENMQRMLK